MAKGEATTEGEATFESLTAVPLAGPIWSYAPSSVPLPWDICHLVVLLTGGGFATLPALLRFVCDGRRGFIAVSAAGQLARRIVGAHVMVNFQCMARWTLSLELAVDQSLSVEWTLRPDGLIEQ